MCGMSESVSSVGVIGASEREYAEGRRNARLYLIGLATSLIGNSALSLVAGIWVKSLTGSSGAAGLVSACIYLPSVIGPLAGVLADRVRRRPFLIVVNLVSGIAVLPLLVVRSSANVWIVYVVMLGYGASLIFIDPAESALFAIMLPVRIRQQVNGIRLALQEGGKFVAPLAGAGLFALLGGGAVAAADAATFGIAAIALARLRVTEAKPAPERRHWGAELAAGLRFLRRSPLLRATVLGGTFAMFLSGLAVAAQYSLIVGLHRPLAFLGVLTSALGAGSIVAALGSSWLISRFGEPVLAVLGLVNGALGDLLLTVGGGVPMAIVAFFILGFALPWTIVAVINISQRLTPGELQGRVSASVGFLLFAPQPLAQAAGALVIGLVNYHLVYLGSVVAWLTIAGWLILRRTRILRHQR